MNEFTPDENLLPQIVGKFYTMDPETEDMLPNATHLRNGMEVLLGDQEDRANSKHMEEDWGWDRALEKNRWCTVTHLESQDQTWFFIGVYEDGTKRKRMFGRNTPWLVKVKSITDAMAMDEEKLQNITNIVFCTLGEQYRGLKEPDTYDPVPLAEQTARQIMGLL